MKKQVLTAFPYEADAKGNVFPVIPLTLEFGKKKDVSALVDSGATISVFKEDVAISLGIDVEKGEEIYLGGVGGHIRGYVHKVKAEFAGKTLVLPVVFSHEYLVSFNLLGREGFFEKFDILFEERKGRVRLI